MDNYMQKMNFTPQIVFEILKFKKSCNLIGREHFDLYTENQIFSRCNFYKIIDPLMKCDLKHKK